MLGRVVNGHNNVPVARIMACLEAVIRVGPACAFPDVSAFVSVLLDEQAGRLASVCDNRDFFKLRRIEPGDAYHIDDALRVACGATETPRTVDWAILSYFDGCDQATVPDAFLTCALGRPLDGERDVGVSLVLGVADSSSWQRLLWISNLLATGWAGLWCSITVGKRFCSLDYNGFYLAHQAIHRTARRMPTVDVGDTLGIHTSDWTRRLRTVAWATFVSRELAAQCEGDLRGPRDRVDVRRLSCGGLCVRLRDEPMEGEFAGPELSGYIQADGIFRSVRAFDGITFLPPWNEDTSREWLGRWRPGGAARAFLSASDYGSPEN